MFTTVVIGCGDRAATYCEAAVHLLKEMKVVAAIDPDPVRLAYMQTHFDVPAAQCYRDMQDVLKQGRIADCVINATMDQYHLQTALPFLEQGYDMLLEKPLVNNEHDLFLLRDTAKRSGSSLTVCHVLRYTPFYRRIKQMILDGKLGEIMNIQTSERVGTFHSSVSYLRGKWNRESKCGSSLLLAKCCHDIDLLCWLNNTTVPALVASQGGRNYFIPGKAPAGAGTRCLVDCPASVRESCIYDAQNMYIDNCLLPQYPWQCTGKDPEDVSQEERVESLKTYNPHGLCIYKAGGDLVDHQNVAVTFANGSTALHTMTLGAMRPGRSIWIQGTRGELEGWFESGTLTYRRYDPATSLYQEETFQVDDDSCGVGMHMGGDVGLMRDFCARMAGAAPSISTTDIDDSINGHLVCYAADRAMRENTVLPLQLR